MNMKKILPLLFLFLSLTAFAQRHYPKELLEFIERNPIYHVERTFIGKSDGLELYTAIFVARYGEALGFVGFAMSEVGTVTRPGIWWGYDTEEIEMRHMEYLFNDWEIPMVQEYLTWIQVNWIQAITGEYVLAIPDGLTLSVDQDSYLPLDNDEDDLIARYRGHKAVWAEGFDKRNLRKLQDMFDKALSVLHERLEQ